MAKFEIKIDEEAARKAVSEAEGLPDLLERVTGNIASAANSASAGNLTQETTRWATKEKVGVTAPVYINKVKHGKKGWVGIVSTGNYSARKDNMENNTIAKSIGAGSV